MTRSTADKAGYDDRRRGHAGPAEWRPHDQGQAHRPRQFGSSGGLVGATLTIFDTAGIQEQFFDGRDVYTGAPITTAPGVSQAQLTAEAAKPCCPTPFEADRGDKLAKKNEDAISPILCGINTFLLVFAAVALVVGTFLIINTFSILVAQRSRELALLRAMGASRRQVNRAVLAEAFVVGLFGSTVGIGVGYLLALGLKALFGVIGLDIGSATFPLKVRTIVIAYVVGLVVTHDRRVPAGSASRRIAPVAAMRDDVALPESSLRWRLIFGTCWSWSAPRSTGVGVRSAPAARAARSSASACWRSSSASRLTAPVVGRPVIACRRLALPTRFRHGRSAGDRRTRCATHGARPLPRAR